MPLQKPLVRQVFFGQGDFLFNYYSCVIISHFRTSANKLMNVYFFFFITYPFISSSSFVYEYLCSIFIIFVILQTKNLFLSLNFPAKNFFRWHISEIFRRIHLLVCGK